MYVKTKELGPIGGGVRPARPPRSANADYCKKNNIASVLLSIDFEKAFDSTEWPAIRRALEKYGFGQFYIDAVFTLYTNIQSTISNNGYWSEWFNINRSSRQGGPLSPLIYNLVTDILEDKIRQNPAIRGIKVDGSEEKCARYANDLWLFLLADTDNINAVMEEMEKFLNFSGSKTNFEKSSAMRMLKY